MNEERQGQRVIRVFVSSTFRDMKAERDELVPWSSGPPDVDGNGDVGISDFLAMLANWGRARNRLRFGHEQRSGSRRRSHVLDRLAGVVEHPYAPECRWLKPFLQESFKIIAPEQ